MENQQKNVTRILILMAIMQFTNAMDFMIIMPLSVHLIPKFNINSSQFSMLVAIYAFSAFASSVSASFYADKFDRKKVLLAAYVGLVAGTLFCGLANSFSTMLLARCFTGIFGGLIGAQTLAIAGDIVPFERRGKAVGILMSGFSLASVAGVPVGIYLANTFSWHIPFITIASIGFLLIPFCFSIIPSVTAHIKSNDNGQNFEVYKSIVADKKQQGALLMMFTLTVSHFSIIPFIAPYMESNVGFTKNQLALIYLVGGAVTLVSSPLIGKLADKHGKFKTFFVLILFSFIPVILITNMPAIPVYQALIVTAFFFIFGSGRMIPSQAIATSVVGNKLRGSFMNINSSVMQLATGIASLIAGLIVTRSNSGTIFNYQWVGLFSVAMCIICIVVAFRLQKQINLK